MNPLRLVLDTNVWLDWLVFDDPGIDPVRAAVARGGAEIFRSAGCERELERVLAYPLRKGSLDATGQAACLARFRFFSRSLGDDPCNALSPGTRPARLPVCRDPDDQLFLELALECGADVLVTKDRDLLVLARRKYQPLPFRILSPFGVNSLYVNNQIVMIHPA